MWRQQIGERDVPRPEPREAIVPAETVVLESAVESLVED